MYSRQIWRHVSSGDVYVVEVDSQDRIKRAAGPLYHGEVEKVMGQGFESDREVEFWMQGICNYGPLSNFLVGQTKDIDKLS